MASCPRIPLELPSIMKDLTKEVLRENPGNIYEFAAEYFETLIRKRDGHLNKNYERFSCPPITSKSLEIQEKSNKIGSLRRGQSTGSHKLNGSAEKRRNTTKIQTFEPSSSISSSSSTSFMTKKIDGKSNNRKLLSNDLVTNRTSRKYNEPRPNTNIVSGGDGVTRKISEATTFEQLIEESGEADGRWLLNRAAIKIQRWVKGFLERKRLRESHQLKVSDSGFLDESALKAAQSITKEPIKIPHDSPTKDDSLLTITTSNIQLLNATLMLQRVIRGYLARKKYKVLLEEKIQQKMVQATNVVQTNDQFDEFDNVVEYNESFEFTDELENAAVAIQKVYRGFHVRKELKEKFEKATDKILDQNEKKEDDETNIESLDKAAEKIQAAYKGHRVRKELGKNVTKTENDDQVGEVDGSESLSIVNQNPKEEELAATKIQATFRGHKTREELKRNEKPKVDDLNIQSNQGEASKEENGEASHDLVINDDLEKAAIKIQAGYRGFKTREELKQNKDEDQSDAKEQMQSSEESNIEIKNEKDEVPNISLDSENVQSAAITIQKNYKGYKTRKNLKDRKVDSSEENKSTESDLKETSELPELNDESEAAAVAIQKHYKGYKTRKDMNLIKKGDVTENNGTEDPQSVPNENAMNEELKATNGAGDTEIDLKDPQLDQAATKIQAGFRGHQTRKTLKKTETKTSEGENEEMTNNEKTDESEEKNSNGNTDFGLNDPDLGQAATKIQAGFRGHQTRKTLKKVEPENGEGSNDDKTMNEKKNEEEETKGTDLDLNDPELDQAAAKIQAGFRGHQTRKTLRNTEKENNNEKSEEMTNNEKTDESEKKNSNDLDFNDPELGQAATKIQAGFRGHQTRKTLKIAETGINDGSSDDTSKETSNSISKGNPEEEVIDIDLNDPEVQEAAKKIQASFKGQKIKSKKKTVAEESKNESNLPTSDVSDTNKNPIEEDQELEKAATKIQAGFRGHKTREELKQNKVDVSAAPSEVPQQSDETTSINPKLSKGETFDAENVDAQNAAVTIQKNFKGYKTRKEFRGKLNQQRSSSSTSSSNQNKNLEMSKMVIQHAADQNVSFDFENPTKEQISAVQKIQRVYRKHRIDMQLKELKTHLRTVSVLDLSDPVVVEQMTQAAKSIQRFFRVHKKKKSEDQNKSSDAEQNERKTGEEKIHHQDSDTHVSVTLLAALETDPHHTQNNTLDDADEKVIELNVHQEAEKSNQSSTPRNDSFEVVNEPIMEKKIESVQHTSLKSESDADKSTNDKDIVKVKSSVGTPDISVVPQCTDLETGEKIIGCHADTVDDYTKLCTDSDIFLNQSDEQKDQNKTDEMKLKSTVVELLPPMKDDDSMSIDSLTVDSRMDLVQEPLQDSLDSIVSRASLNEALNDKQTAHDGIEVDEPAFIEKKVEVKEPICIEKRMYKCPEEKEETCEESINVENQEKLITEHEKEASPSSEVSETDQVKSLKDSNDESIQIKDTVDNCETSTSDKIDDSEVAKVLLDPDIIENSTALQTIEIKNGSPVQPDKSLNTEETKDIESENKSNVDVKEAENAKKSKTTEETKVASEERNDKKQSEEEIDIDLNDPEVQDVAKKMQASFRGNKFRSKKKQDTKEVESEEQTSGEDPKQVKDNENPKTTEELKEIQSDEIITNNDEKHDKDDEKSIKTEETKDVKAEEKPINEEKQKEEEIDINLNDPNVEDAAKKIQASFRGNKFQKKQATKEVESEENKSSEDDKQVETTEKSKVNAEDAFDDEKKIFDNDQETLTEKDILQDKRSATSKIPISKRSLKSKTMSQDDKTKEVKGPKLKKTTSSFDVKSLAGPSFESNQKSDLKLLGSQIPILKPIDNAGGEAKSIDLHTMEQTKEAFFEESVTSDLQSNDESKLTSESALTIDESTKSTDPTSNITSSVDDSSHTEPDEAFRKTSRKSPDVEDEVSEIVSFDTSTHDKSLVEEEYYSLKKKELQLDSRVSSTGSYSSGVNPKSTTTTNDSSSSKQGSTSSNESEDIVPDAYTTRRTTTLDSDEIVWGKIADSDSSAPSTATDRTVIHLRSLTPEVENEKFVLEEYKEIPRPTTSRGLGQISRDLRKTFSTESDDVVVGTIPEIPEKDDPKLNETFVIHKSPKKDSSQLNKTFIIERRLDTAPKTADSDDVVIGHIDKNGDRLEEPVKNEESTEKRSFNDDETLDELKALSDTPRRRRLFTSMSVVQPPSESDSFNPFNQTSIYQQQYMDKIHGQSMSDTNDTAYGSDRDIEDEDQFDDFYPGNIRQKIMASSFSITDSDYFDPHKPVESNEDRIVTALETITSTDSESTTASASTKVANNARRVLPDSKYSIGNAAITESLDEFVEKHENANLSDMNDERITMLQKKITRGTKGRFKRNALTEEIPSQASIDEEGEVEPGPVIQIKLAQKSFDSVEKSSDSSFSEDNRAAFRNKKMSYYSLNVDKYDTAARRSLLQRENAFQKNSTPDEDLSTKSISTGSNGNKKDENVRKTPSNADEDSEKEKTDAEDVEEDEVATAIETNVGRPSTVKLNQKEKNTDNKVVIQPIPKFQGNANEGVGSKPNSAGSQEDDVRFPLLSIMRQRTLPVQIDTSIMRILPKHVVKRIKSANHPNSGTPKPKFKK